MNVYLSKEEQAIVTDAAEKLGTTQAYVVRLAFRSVFGLPIGPSGESELQYICTGHVRNLTSVR